MLLILKVEQAHEGFLFSPIEEKFKVSGGTGKIVLLRVPTLPHGSYCKLVNSKE